MSVYYVFHEKFIVEDFTKDDLEDEISCMISDAIYTMRWQMSILCSQLMCDDEFNCLKMKIDLDGNLTEYSSIETNGILSAEIQEAIVNITKAKNIKIDMDYSYVWRMGKDYLSIGPFVMSDLLEEYNAKVFDYMYYAMFNWADCSCDTGVLCVYGRLNDSLHMGIVDYSVTNEIPEFGNWYEPITLKTIENDDVTIPQSNIARVEQICNKLREFCFECEFSTENNILYLLLNEVSLKSPDKTQDFTETFKELAKLVDRPQDENLDGIFYTAGFYDISDKAPNLLKIEIAYNGTARILTALSF